MVRGGGHVALFAVRLSSAPRSMCSGNGICCRRQQREPGRMPCAHPSPGNDQIFSRGTYTARRQRALRAASGSTSGWTVLGPVQPLASSVRNPQNSDKSCVLRVVGAMEVRLSITQTSKRQTLCTTKSQAGHALPIDRFFARLTRRTAASLRRSFLSCNIASSQPRVPAPRASAGNENKKRRTSLFVLVEGCPCSPPLQRSSFHVQVTPS